MVAKASVNVRAITRLGKRLKSTDTTFYVDQDTGYIMCVCVRQSIMDILIWPQES